MQGLADGYFVIPYTISNYLASHKTAQVGPQHDAFKEAENNVRTQINKLMSIRGARTVDSFHKELGHVMWEFCGMSRNAQGLQQALQKIPKIREEFWSNVRIPGEASQVNPELEKAGRVADFLEQGELMCWDALERNESCGGHFREEFQTADNEAKRDDANFCHVAAWEWNGPTKKETRHQEELEFENVHLATRSYK
jgi:succinate dehydrogenase / fumarate reductase flavoprotein subunit